MTEADRNAQITAVGPADHLGYLWESHVGELHATKVLAPGGLRGEAGAHPRGNPLWASSDCPCSLARMREAISGIC